ncbi:MAG: CapA family protein [Eubacteriales bacterium]|nr:CapA family protein [Eubacteriales bacterium]
MKKLIAGILLLSIFFTSCAYNPMPPAALPENADAERSQDAESNIEDTGEASETSETSETKRISFLAAGDNIVYRGNVGEAAKYALPGGRKYNFSHQYSVIAHLIAGADIAFVNQETLMADGYEFSYYPRFNGPQDMGHDLTDLGFDIINIANNHMLDWGAPALGQTIDFWRNQTEAFIIGDYLNADEYESVNIYECRDIDIAFLSYTYGTNLGLTGPSDIAIPYLKKETVTRQVSAAREAADLVIVSVHWGNENHFQPDASQIEYAQLMCDAGADVVIGHHPHVIGPVVWLEGKDGHRMLCAYSLGNLAAEMAHDYNMVGGLLTFDIISEDGQKPYIAQPVLIPTVFYFNISFRNNRVYLMRDFTEDMAAGHGIGFYGNHMTAQKLKSYVTDTVSEEFLPDYIK